MQQQLDTPKVRTSSSSCSVRTTTSRPAMRDNGHHQGSLAARLLSGRPPCTASLWHGRSGCADLTYGVDDRRTQALGAQHRGLQVPERLDMVLGRAPLRHSTRRHHRHLHVRYRPTDRNTAQLDCHIGTGRTVRSTRAALMPALIIASRVSTLRHAGPSVQMTAGDE